jgi:hypothetical protein
MINTIHSWFTDNSDFYKNWHEKDYHHHVHWAGFVAVALITTFSLTSAIYTTYLSTAYAAALPSALVMGTDHIPDFAQDFTKPQVTAQKSGNWSDPTVWQGGILPTASDIVVIPSGQTITYDSTTGTAYTVSINGTLKFRTDINTKLTVTNLEVMPTGYLEIGTVATPVNSSVDAEIVFADTAIDQNIDPEQWGTGFLSLGKVRINGAMKSPTFLRVATEPMAGQNTITLAQAPTGWNVGDRIFIPDTRHFKQGEVSQGSPFFVLKPQWEEFTIQGISGSVITLDRPLTYNHKGARDVAGNLDFVPHVGNLTRNVTFKSANPSGTRGHMAMIHMADADIRYTTFKDMGRTTYDPVAVGTNQKGRYALHMHHDMGPMTTPANGYQFTLIGNAVDGGSSVQKFKWGITVHDSHFGLIQDNVVYNMGGAGIMTEDGNETMNVFDHNFVARVAGAGGRGDERGTEFGFEGSGIWLRGPNNIIRNNVVANFVNNGIAYFHIYLGNVKVPNYKGADTTVAGQYTTVNGYSQTIPEFNNNEIYGSGSVGLTNWWLGSEYGTPRTNNISVFKNTKIWHVSDRAVYNYPSSNLTYDGLIIRGDATALGSVSCCGVGYEGGDYFANNITFKNIDIQGMRTGMHISTWVGGTQTIENSTLINRNDIGMDTMWTSSCDSSWIPPRLTVIKNTKMAVIPGSGGKTIFMNYQPNPVSNVIQKDEVYVVDYNQVAGDNFRVYYNQADPNYIVPQGFYSSQYGAQCVSLMSVPVAGLTSTQAFAQYNVAVGGSPATCSDKTTHPEINGITCPYTSIPTAPLTKVVNPTGLLPGPINSGTPTATVSMSASPTSVASDGSATITWSSTLATTCTASGGWTGTKATSGTATVNPTANTTYTLTCSGTNINSASQSVTVSVGTGPAPSISMSASPTSVIKGSTSTITWSTTNATSCTASGDWSGTRATSGSQSVTPPDGQSNYILTCVSSGGVSATQNIIVPATTSTSPLATVNISASPTTITSGNSSTITWSSTNATTCTASGAWSGTKATSGTATVSPTANSTYTLTCSGANATSGSNSVSITVNPVTISVPTVSFSASPSSISSGSSSNLSWSTTNVTSCTASGAWSGTKATSGSLTVSPTANSTYILTCTGTNGSTVSQSSTVSVVSNPVPTVTISATPTVVTSGNSSTITWSSTNATTCTASGAWSGTKATSGSLTVSPTADSVYSLTCSGAGGTSSSQSVSINVTSIDSTGNTGGGASGGTSTGGNTGGTGTTNTTLSFVISASPASIKAGESSTISWSSTGYSLCQATAWTKIVAPSGSQVVSPKETTKYTMACSGEGLPTYIDSVTINVTAGSVSSGQTNTSVDTTAPTISNVTKTNITKNSVKISWRTNEPATGQLEFVGNCPTTGCVTGLNTELTLNHSVTVVNLNPKTNYVFKIKSSDAAGNLRVMSGENILSFTTLAGVTTGTVNTTPVNTTTPSSQLVTISASPSSITLGGSSTITWSSKSYTSCSASGGWAGNKNLSGSQVVSPARTSTYIITCRGVNMTPVSKSVTINIVNSISVQKTTPTSDAQTTSTKVQTNTFESGVSDTSTQNSSSLVDKIKGFLDKTLK